MSTVDLPRHVYRYYGLSNRVRRRYAKQAVVESQLYLARADQFNDPFDFQVDIRRDATDDELRTYLRLHGRDHGGLSDWTDDQIEEWAAQSVEKFRRMWESPDSTTRVDEAHRQLRDENGICVFTSRPDSTLMWSHYADSHKGMCLRFDTTLDGGFFANIHRVEYADNFPVVRAIDVLLNYGHPANVEWAATKAADWRYEHEWRIVRPQLGIVSYPPECLTGINVGARVTDRDRCRIANWCKRRPTIEIFEAQVSASQYRLNINPV